MEKNILGTQRITPLIFRMGLPSMLGMLVIALYNVVDTFFISGLGTEAIAAVSIVFPIAMIVSGIAFAFGTGAASAISRMLGKNENEKARRVANTSFFTAILLASLLAMLVGLFFDSILSLFTTDQLIMSNARAYGLIILIGSVINVGTVTANNMIRAEGFAKVSMITMSLGAILNIILDPIFIYRLNLGIKGAAIATVVAQTLALLYILTQYRRLNSVVKISYRYFALDPPIYREVLKIGIPVLIYQGLNSISIAMINQQASYYGAEAIAAMGIVTKIIVFMSYVVFGFVKGLQPIAGYNYGLGRKDRLIESIQKTKIILTGYCIAAALLVIAFSNQIMGWFSTDVNVINLGVKVLLAWSATFIFLGYQMTYVTAFLAMGKAKEGSILGLSRQGIVLIPLLIILRLIFGFQGIVLAQPCADILTFMMSIYFARKMKIRLNDIAIQDSIGVA